MDPLTRVVKTSRLRPNDTNHTMLILLASLLIMK